MTVLSTLAEAASREFASCQNTIRAAVDVLRQERLVVTAPGRAVFVR